MKNFRLHQRVVVLPYGFTGEILRIIPGSNPWYIVVDNHGQENRWQDVDLDPAS